MFNFTLFSFKIKVFNDKISLMKILAENPAPKLSVWYGAGKKAYGL